VKLESKEMVELVINGQVIGVFPDEKTCRRWIKREKITSSLQILYFGTMVRFIQS